MTFATFSKWEGHNQEVFKRDSHPKNSCISCQENGERGLTEIFYTESFFFLLIDFIPGFQRERLVLRQIAAIP